MITAFLTDSTLCIGCKACEVACKEWNDVPADGFTFTGTSYDNTGALGHSTWRHVKFIERSFDLRAAVGAADAGYRSNALRWDFSSDVCKHCENAGCLEACPTGSIVRTEFGGVYIQPDICNGCGYCVVACPFGVVDRRPGDGRAFKCTFCYDRQKVGLQPACATACPTQSIQFGEIGELRAKAAARVEELRARGIEDATVYDPVDTSVGGTHAIFVFRGQPEDYNLPSVPEVPAVNLGSAWSAAAVTAGLMLAGTVLAFLSRRPPDDAQRTSHVARRTSHVARGGCPMSGYYDRPALKAPVWTWEIPAYFFVGGAAGAAALVGAVARRTGGSERLVRDARWIAAAGSMLSPPLLISDLGRPERFLNMLRVFKLQSPMSVGAWTLVAFSNAASGAAFADFVQRTTGGRVPVRVIADASEMLSAATGLVLSTYTGVLLGATAIPVWSRNAVILPLHFGASGLGSAVSLLELLGHHERSLNAIGIGTALVETAIAAHVEFSEEESTRPLREGDVAPLARAAGLLSGPVPLLLRTFCGRSRTARRAAAASTLAGSLLTRIAWLSAGRPSSRGQKQIHDTATSGSRRGDAPIA